MLKLQQLPPEEPRLRINADGTLQIGRKDGQIEFAFHCLGLNFEANTRPTAFGTVVQVVTDIALLPYSAEGVATRRAVVAIIDAYVAGEAVPYTELRKVWTDPEGWVSPPALLGVVNLFEVLNFIIERRVLLRIQAFKRRDEEKTNCNLKEFIHYKNLFTCKFF